jgi:hypothetical protein
MKRGFGIAPGPFLHAALPNRTCGLPRIRLSTSPVGVFVVLSLPMAMVKGWSIPGDGIAW